MFSILQKPLKCFLHPSNTIAGVLAARNISTALTPLHFQITNCLLGEPMKRRRRLDPQIVKQREERKRRKLEKQIRKMERQLRQLKPIVECEIPEVVLKDEKKLRLRFDPKLTNEESEHRILTLKEWSAYRLKSHLADCQMIDRLLYSQQKALDELRNESEELYQEAIQIDPLMIPKTIKGPTVTPKIKAYESPDGEYIDTSKKW